METVNYILIVLENSKDNYIVFKFFLFVTINISTINYKQLKFYFKIILALFYIKNLIKRYKY